jgi:protease-4
MFKRLLSEGSSNSGNMVNFITSLKRELKLWKLAVLVLAIVILIIFANNYKSNNEPITTKQISHLGKDVIAEIVIDGTIQENVEREKMLDEILKSNKVKGLLVVINTGGGAPNHAEIVYLKLKTIREKIPVIVFIKEIGASAGYMISVGGHKIVAMRSSLVGSIGVRFGMGRFDVSEILKKNFVGYEQYSTSEYKVMGDPLTKNTEKEREYFKELLSENLKVFTSIVSEERKLFGKNLERVTNAKIFLGEKALELGLIDTLGTKETAINILKEDLKQRGETKEFEVQEINPEPKKTEATFMKLANSFSSFFNFFQRLFYGKNENPILAQI